MVVGDREERTEAGAGRLFVLQGGQERRAANQGAEVLRQGLAGVHQLMGQGMECAGRVEGASYRARCPVRSGVSFACSWQLTQDVAGVTAIALVHPLDGDDEYREQSQVGRAHSATERWRWGWMIRTHALTHACTHVVTYRRLPIYPVAMHTSASSSL